MLAEKPKQSPLDMFGYRVCNNVEVRWLCHASGLYGVGARTRLSAMAFLSSMALVSATRAVVFSGAVWTSTSVWLLSITAEGMSFSVDEAAIGGAASISWLSIP